MSTNLSAADILKRIGELSPEKQKLLRKLLEKENSNLLQKIILPQKRDGSSFPLSFGQKRLWFLDKLDPGNPIYNESGAFRLKGNIDFKTAQRSLAEIVRRHEILRTTFGETNGEPVQVIAPSLEEEPLTVVDLTELPEDEREQEASRLASRYAKMSFDLSRAPLFRATLFKLGEEDHVFLITAHHIILDGWSIGILVREMLLLYQAYRAGLPSPLPPLPVQYADYAVWQREWLTGEVLDRLLSYWRKQLGGIPPVLELPTDRPRPPVMTFRGSTKSFVLPSSLYDRLKELSRREGATLFMTLVAAFNVLLHRYSGSSDIVIGTPVAGRVKKELEGLVGLFMNSLVLRTDLSGDPTFRELLGRVKDVCLGAYAHQDMPFEKLVEDLQPVRDMSRHPIFQVMFALFEDLRESLTGREHQGISVNPLEVDNETAKLDLIFFVWEGSQRLTCTVEYNTDLFDEATIERMFCNFETLLEGIAGDPAMPISRLPLISPSELRKVLVDWNATERDYPRTACVHELIEAQARRTPDHISLIAGGESLTYRELNSRANKLARYLRNLGVEPDQLVGICMEPSADMAVSLLGILKAGGAYFPLDPSYPKERLSFMMDDAAVRVVVTQRRLVGELPRSDARVVCIDSDWQKISTLSGDDLEPRATSENLAYVIYTSGSTGKPKGVMIAHRSVVNHNLAMMSSFELSPQDRVLQYHSINFDAAVETIFPTWMSGATVVFRTQKVTAPGADLRRLIENGRTTVLSFSSAYWNEWVHELAASGGVLPDYVRLVVIGGDRASPESVEVWLRLFGNRIRLLNTYGPTEATVTATQYDITGASQWVRREIPIGKPISNTSVYILDRNLEPVPIGVPGELFIGGDGVARGYLNREDVTAERFIRDPFSTKPGARMYRTGDLARFLPDGNIEFLGRLDNQVKIRGYRIEPGEVEAAVLWHDAVRDCVVVPRDDDFGQKRLVAYVVPYDGRHVGVSELRSFLAERLPEYMVPSYFVLLDALPLTPNGKVDRKALPTPTYDRQETKESYVPPRDDVERELVRIWEEIFGIHPIGVKDNFFQLGGHSFLALRLMAQINRVFGVNIPLVALFQGGTIEHLALAVLHRNAFSESSPLVKIQPQGAKPPFFCVHPIGGSVLCYANLARSLGQDRPFYGIESPGIHGRLEPMGSIEDMAACYIEAMREVQPRGPYLIGGHSFGGIVAFEMAQQLRARGEEVSLLVLLDSWPRMRTEGVAKEEIEFLIDTVSVDVGIPKDVILKAWEGTTGLGFAALMESQSDMVTNLARFIAPETEFEHIKRYIDVFYANLAAMRSYSPREYEGKIALIRAEEQLPGEDPTMGWGELVEEVEVSVAPGNHVTMLREPNVHQLALKLKSLLDACGGG